MDSKGSLKKKLMLGLAMILILPACFSIHAGAESNHGGDNLPGSVDELAGRRIGEKRRQENILMGIRTHD